MRFPCLIFLLLISCKTAPEKTKAKVAAGSPPPTHYHFVSEFEKYVETNHRDTVYPGAAIVIVKDSTIIYMRGLGVKRTGTTDSVNIHTVFRLASVSKGFASILAGVFVQKGLLKWDDPVIKYLPEFKLKNPEYTKLLTVRHLLNQTTGLPRHTYTNMIECGTDYKKLRDKLSEVALNAAPGTVHSYQNVAYSVIADILKKISGKDYTTLLKEEIFLPLGMNDASASFADFENAHNHAIPHLNTKRGFIPVKNTDEYYTVLPAAGVNASISDMGQWLKALLGNYPKVLSPQMLSEVYAPSIGTPKRRKYFFMRWLPVRETYYGLGWRVIRYNEDTLIYHGGHVKGFRAEIAFSPRYKVGIAIICNAPGKFVNNTIPVFFDMFYEHYKPAKKK